MEKINEKSPEFDELDNTIEGLAVKELIVKINEIIDWINTQ